MADLRPIPDPTTLTTDAIERDVTAALALIHAQMKGADELTASHFDFVREEFATVERLRVEQKKDTKDAVDAALTAQKEANAKSELSTKEQLKALADTFGTAIDGLTKQIDNNKDNLGEVDRRLSSRLDRGEGQKVGEVEHRNTGRADVQTTVMVVSCIVGFSGMLLGAIALFVR